MKEYTVTWSMTYEANDVYDAVEQAYAEMCELARDPSEGANYVSVSVGDNRTTVQLDNILCLSGSELLNSRDI